MEKTYRASKDYIYRKIANENVLISVGGNIANFNGYIRLNESAVYLWNTLQNKCTIDELVQGIKEEFSISDEQARTDVTDFLEELKAHNMVVEE